MLYETAARAEELLSLNIDDLDLKFRRGRVTSKGGAIEYVHWAPAPPASCPGCCATAPQGRCSSSAGARPCPVRAPLPRRTSARRPDAAGSPTRAPSTCSNRPPPPATRTSRAGRTASSATQPSSTWQPTDAPPPSSRPNPGICTWAASAGTSGSGEQTSAQVTADTDPQHDAGLADQPE